MAVVDIGLTQDRDYNKRRNPPWPSSRQRQIDMLTGYTLIRSDFFLFKWRVTWRDYSKFDFEQTTDVRFIPATQPFNPLGRR